MSSIVRARSVRTNPDRKIFQDLGDHKYASQNAIFELDVDDGELIIYPNFGGQVIAEDLDNFEKYYNSPRGMTPNNLARVPYYHWENKIAEINRAYNIAEDPPPRRYRLLPAETEYRDERPKMEVAVEEWENLNRACDTQHKLNEECIEEFEKILALFKINYDHEDIWNDVNCMAEHIIKELKLGKKNMVVSRDLFCRGLAVVQLYQDEHRNDSNAEQVESLMREALNSYIPNQ